MDEIVQNGDAHLQQRRSGELWLPRIREEQGDPAGSPSAYGAAAGTRVGGGLGLQLAHRGRRRGARVPGLLDGVGQFVGEQLVADSGLRIERPGRKVHRAVLSEGAGAPRLSTLDGRGVGMDAELTEVGSQTPLHVRAQPVVQPLAAGPT